MSGLAAGMAAGRGAGVPAPVSGAGPQGQAS